jgi:hypothetical protein
MVDKIGIGKKKQSKKAPTAKVQSDNKPKAQKPEQKPLTKAQSPEVAENTKPTPTAKKKKPTGYKPKGRHRTHKAKKPAAKTAK